MTLRKKINRLVKRLRSGQNGCRISFSGMPNGFFLNDLLWFGDAESKETAVSRGFLVEPGELESLDDAWKADVVDRLRVMLAQLGEGYSLQIRYVVGSDYTDALDAYHAMTEAVSDKWRYRWQLWNRTEREARCRLSMAGGNLRRETLAVFFTKTIDSEPPFSVSESGLRAHFTGLARRESLAFESIQGNALRTLFPDARVRPMGDREHFLYCRRFLNPSAGVSVPKAVLDAYDPSLSIHQNCLGGDLVQLPVPGVSFSFDGLHHALLVMNELPKRSGPGAITRLTGFGFTGYEVVLNLYPQPLNQVVKTIEAAAAQAQGEASTRPRSAARFRTQVDMANERIVALERGQAASVNVFLAVRLWHRDPDVLVSRGAMVRNAFLEMAGAQVHHATNPETARQLFFQTWPGWTCSPYRGYDQQADDATAAELIPWTASFTGRLEGAEALYVSPRGALVGVRFFVDGVPQHFIFFGATRAGKSLLITDLWAQTGHQFDFALIVDEGRSHVVTAQTAGATPVILTPNGSTTLNYLDPNGTPLTREHLGFAVALGLQMIKGNEEGLSAAPSLLTAHLNALYDGAWEDWATRHPEQAQRIARRAYGLSVYLKTRMNGEGNQFIDAWAEVRDWEAREPEAVAAFLGGLDEGEVARFQAHPVTKGLVRDLGLAYLSPEDQPTHTQLVEMLTLTPIEGEEENPEAVRLGDALSTWKADGPYGCIFDGVTTVRLDADFTYFDLGLIPKAMEALRDAAYFVALNYSRQQIVKRPRAERKLVLFEEAARVLRVPGGAALLAEFFTQAGKYGCVVGIVLQQLAALKSASEDVRASVFDNARLFFVSAQPSPKGADDIGDALELSEACRQTVKRYSTPQDQEGAKNVHSNFLMVIPNPYRKMVGTLRNYASRRVVYAGASDKKLFDERAKALSAYDDVVAGIIAEAGEEECE
jgi:type IV secretion system protein TrbE